MTSTRNLELVRSLGPEEVIDYTTEDFTRRPDRYDVIFDVAATRSFDDLRRALAPDGKIVLAGGAKAGGMFAMVFRPVSAIVRSRYLGARWLVPLLARITTKDLLALKELVESAKVCPVIDREYSLSDAAEAIRYLGTGHARAKVVINVA